MERRPSDVEGQFLWKKLVRRAGQEQRGWWCWCWGSDTDSGSVSLTAPLRRSLLKINENPREIVLAAHR